MIKEEELIYYRENVIHIYVNPIKREIEAQEKEYKRQEKQKQLAIKPNYKQCKWCGTVKPITEFYKNILKPKGVFDYCKECAIKRQKELRELRKCKMK